jgi:hypothetical protein
MALKDYSELLNNYPVFDHSAYLIESFNSWINAKGLNSQHFYIHPELVKQVSLNLYIDIKRVKEFHDISEVNSKKFAAYQAAWIIKIKPIQLIHFESAKRKYYVLANELFALQTVIAHLYDMSFENIFNPEELEKWSAFFKRLIYHFHHRITDAQGLELAFEAMDLLPRHPSK